MSQLLTDTAPILIALATGTVVFLVWLALRRRVAAQTVERAQAAAERLLREAERDVEARRKEVVLAAKEEAHELLRTAEGETRKRQDEIAALERDIASQSHTLSDRQSAMERAELELQKRERFLDKGETEVSAQAARYETLVTDQQRELQRVAGMTADEARRCCFASLNRTHGVTRRIS